MCKSQGQDAKGLYWSQIKCTSKAVYCNSKRSWNWTSLLTSLSAGIIYVCFVYFAAIAQVWINLHRQNVFYTVMLWKGSQVPQELGGRRRSHDEKGNQGVGGFRFTNILELFSIYFFFSITLLYHFFSILFLPTTSTHYPRPTTFSYTRFKDGFQVTWNFLEWFQLSDFNEMQSKDTWDFTWAFTHAFLVK